jgi:hypothetical protein
MEDRRPVEPAEHDLRETRPPITKGDSLRPAGWLAAPAVAIVAVVCCAGPLLFAALLASGGGVWLAAHGYTLGATALIVLAVILAWWIRTRMRKG